MFKGIETSDSSGLNKERASMFRAGYRVLQITEKGWRKYRPKQCEYNNKDENNSTKTLIDKNIAK